MDFQGWRWDANGLGCTLEWPNLEFRFFLTARFFKCQVAAVGVILKLGISTWLKLMLIVCFKVYQYFLHLHYLLILSSINLLAHFILFEII